MPTPTITDLDALPAVLTMRDVQQLLGVSRVTVYELANRRDFPAIRLGRSIRVTRAALLRWLDQQAGVEGR